MGVKSYVAGLKADSVNTGLNMANDLMNVVANDIDKKNKIKFAKDETDYNREMIGVGNSLNSFIEKLKYDRDYQNYGEKVNEQFGVIHSEIMENQNISQAVKTRIVQEQFPLLKEQARGTVDSLTVKAQMAEIELEIEGFGNLLASKEDLTIEQTLQGYRNHLESLDLYNPYTVNKMVEEYDYTVAPVKALQNIQDLYSENYVDESFDYDKTVSHIAERYGLDATQTQSLREKASTVKKDFDTQVDNQFKEQKTEIDVQVAQAFDKKQVFDASSLDGLIESVPTRHKLELYSVKNKVHANNDNLIVSNLEAEIEKGTFFTDSGWDTLEMIHDPNKRSETKVKAIQSNINNIVSSGSFQEKRAAVDDSELPLTDKEKVQVKAEFTLEELKTKEPEEVVKALLNPTIVNTNPQKKDKEVTKRVENPPIVDMGTTNRKESEPIVNSESTGGVLDVEVLPIQGSQIVNSESTDSDNNSQEVGTVTTEREQEATKSEENTQNVDSINNPEPTQAQKDLWAERTKAGEAYLKELRSQNKAVNFIGDIVGKKTEIDRVSPDMPQEEILSDLLVRIKNGEGRYISQTELSYISNDSFRQEISSLASIRDSFVIDSTLALDFIDQLRRDPNVSTEKLRTVVRGFVNEELIKADTAEDKGLTNKYSFAKNDNFSLIEESISNALLAIYPAGKGEAFSEKKLRLRTSLQKAIDDAVAMNPDLAGKDFPLLQRQIDEFVVNKTSKDILDDLGKISKFMSDEDISDRIENLERSDISTFNQDVMDGRYDLLLNYDLLQRPEIRSLRNPKTKDGYKGVLDVITRETNSAYRDYEDLYTNGTGFEKLQVMANTSFLLVGGTLENALKGSFNIQASDMKIAGKQWAFSDPEIDGLYFVATDTDINKRGTLGWGMFSESNGGVSNMTMFRDYVDPQLQWDIENLEEKINDPGFSKKKTVADYQQTVSPLGVAGLGYSPVKIQEQFDSEYYGVLEEHKKKTQELNNLIRDITTYRRNLLGLENSTLRKRL